MNENIEFLTWLASTRLWSASRAILILAVGLLVARIASIAVAKLLDDKVSIHNLTIIRRSIYYVLIVLFIMSALRELGFDLSVVIGAAGILTVAIGFASQTSASNLISGLFLMIERPFSIKDVVRVGSTTGEVISIDLLSVKLRTFDNLFVRIPNETMIKSEITTLTKFPIRRLDLQIGIAYREDVNKVKEVLLDIAEKNNLCLEEPAPLFIILGFGNSSVDLQFSVWAKRENFLTVKNELFEKIKNVFDEQGIEIPFPHVSLYAGSETGAIPIRVVGDTEELKVTNESPSNK
ncbi:mechanosensitive ion channel family protein [Reinekea marina]|uniref:Small-conductance mechanosensitive channel n=1 Tax=Reinekea marina TaxID=1310421 RepID=A0ABV7WSL9_9GAMM|nr:mechanosensitive ion channel family protein [Reinekea marina]MDN3650462.1 mechanosensitive ion channel family protein [Reinekea marina]